jgi:hypothetical protein
MCHAETGGVELHGVRPLWRPFVPVSEGEPLLRKAWLLSASCQGSTLALAYKRLDQPDAPVRLRLFRGPDGVSVGEYTQPREHAGFALSGDGRLLARQVGAYQLEVRDAVSGGLPRCVTLLGRFHHAVRAELGERWLLLRTQNIVHLMRWDEGRLVCSQTRGDWEAFRNRELPGARLPFTGVQALPGRPPPLTAYDPERFRLAAWNNLIAVVDAYGQVFLFEATGALACAFFVFRQQVAAWMPDGTRFGPFSLLGERATLDADRKIGQALWLAWERGEGILT